MKKTFAINRIMYISLFFTLLLIAARMMYTREWNYASLIWNLFLAFLPFLLSKMLLRQENSNRKTQYLLVGAWLLFFPNAPYIITDFVHLTHRPPVPFWYDLIIIFWASWNGLLLGLLSLMNVEKFLHTRLKEKMVNAWIYLFILLCGFGVYAGRYLRWNSWDVVANPHDIMKDVKYLALNPEDNMRAWGVTVVFSLLMSTCYFTIKTLKQIGREMP